MYKMYGMSGMSKTAESLVFAKEMSFPDGHSGEIHSGGQAPAEGHIFPVWSMVQLPWSRSCPTGTMV